MFSESKFPVRLLVRCAICAQTAEVDRALWEKERTKCPLHQEEMRVIACASGAITGSVWEVVTAVATATSPEAVLDAIRDREPSLN